MTKTKEIGESIVITRAEEKDLSSVYYIEQKCFKYPYPFPLLLFYHKIFPEGFRIAKIGNEIVGYIIFIIEKDNVGHIISLAVHPDYRRRGIGYKLLLSAIKFLEMIDINVIKLEVRVSNIAAIKLYEKVGFIKTKILKKYYKDGEDGYQMLYRVNL